MASNEEERPLQLLSLPEEILDNVLLYLTYEEISDVRLVWRCGLNYCTCRPTFRIQAQD